MCNIYPAEYYSAVQKTGVMKIASKLIVTILRKVIQTQKDKQSIFSALCETAEELFSFVFVGSVGVLLSLLWHFSKTKRSHFPCLLPQHFLKLCELHIFFSMNSTHSAFVLFRCVSFITKNRDLSRFYFPAPPCSNHFCLCPFCLGRKRLTVLSICVFSNFKILLVPLMLTYLYKIVTILFNNKCIRYTSLIIF